MSRDSYVYVYFRPTGEPCYIGKGRGARRWLDHLKGRSSNRHLQHIIAKAGGEIPHVKIRDHLTHDEAISTEIALIKAIGRVPYGPLVNMTDGGEGTLGRECSIESRERMRAAKLGTTLTVQHRSRIGESSKGRIKTTEQLAKYRLAVIGTKRKSLTIEVCDRISAALRGKPKSEAHREKMRNRVHTEETKAKIKQSTKCAKARKESTMSQLSQIFGVKSNAIRKAVALGMTREAAHKALVAVSGGYQFTLPTAEFTEANTGRPVEVPAEVQEIVEAVQESEREPTDAELSAGRAEHTITNGQKAVSFGPTNSTLKALGAEVVEPSTIAAAVKPAKRVRAVHDPERIKAQLAKRQAKAPKAVKPAKTPKVAKPAKAPKAPRTLTTRATGTAKRGTPEYDAVMAARRKSQGRRGVMDATVALLRKKWVSATDLMAMNEWQSSTLRGLLSLEKKKQGFDLHSRKVDGERQYRIAS